jgi:hypothetical protein
MSDVRVFCTLTFDACHYWPDAPEDMLFLGVPHRHLFRVRAEKCVTHDDRDIEFISWKWEITRWLDRKLTDGAQETATWSCEQWARAILEEFDADLVEVSEDGENGAVVTK